MRTGAASLLAIGLIAGSASAAAQDQRPPLKGASAIRIANYGAPSVMVEGRARVNSIVEELIRLRQKTWSRGDSKLKCYSTVVLLKGGKRSAEFRVTPDRVVERPVEKGQGSYSLATDQADMPTLGKLLAEIAAAKDCN